MAKNYYFFPDVNTGFKTAFLLDKEASTIHTTNAVLKPMFDGVNKVDKGVADAIVNMVNKGEMPQLGI